MTEKTKMIMRYLNHIKDPVRAVHEKAYLKTQEISLGIPRGPIRTYVKQLIRQQVVLSIADLKQLWDTHILDARYLAMTYAEYCEERWNKQWVRLFIYWAQARDTGWHNTDVLGPHLLGTAYLKGLCSRSDILKLKKSLFLWTWRVGMTTLILSLKQSSKDWPLLCAFAKDCVLPGSKFHKQYFALKGFSMTLRWSIGANKQKVLRYLKDNKQYLSKTFIQEVYNKATIGRKR